MHAKATTEITLRMSKAEAMNLNSLAKAGRQLLIEYGNGNDPEQLHDAVIDTLDKIYDKLDNVLEL